MCRGGRDGDGSAPRHRPFIVQPDGLGWLFAPPDWSTGHCPTHYEPHESPSRTCSIGRAPTRPARACATARTRYNQRGPRTVFPFALTTYRLTEHHTAGGMSRTLPYLSELQPEPFVRGLRPSSPRMRGLDACRLGDDRDRPQGDRSACDGDRPLGPADRRRTARFTRSASLTTGAAKASAGPAMPRMSSSPVLDLNTHIAEYKALTCDVIAGRRPRGGEPRALVEDYRRARWDAEEGRHDSRGGSMNGHRATAARRTRASASSPTRSVCIGCKACEVACKEWNDVPRREGFTGTPTTTRATSAPTPGATWPSSSSAGRLDGAARSLVQAAAARTWADGRPGDLPGRRRPALADGLRRLQALHPRRLPRGVPHRRTVPHRVRHGRRPAGHLQRLRLLRPRLPVRRARPPRGGRPGLQVHAVLRPPQGRQEPACAKACPTDSIQFGELDELRERAGERVEQLHGRASSEARLYGEDPDDGVGGDGAFFLLLDEPEVYGLPPDPVDPTRDLGTIWAAAGAAASRSAARLAAAVLWRAADDAAARRRGRAALLLRRPVIKAPVWTRRSPCTSSSAASRAPRAAGRPAGRARRRRARPPRLAARSPGSACQPRAADRRPRAPERFLNMLRVFKVTSPMSVGSWVLRLGRPRPRGRGRRRRSSAVPARRRAARVAACSACRWRPTPPRCWPTPPSPSGTSARRELPFLFAASAR